MNLERLERLWANRDWKAIKDYAAGRLVVLSVWLEAEGKGMYLLAKEPDNPTMYAVRDPHALHHLMTRRDWEAQG